MKLATLSLACLLTAALAGAGARSQAPAAQEPATPAPTTAAPTTPAAPDAYRPGDGVKAPRLLKEVKPTYPPSAMGSGIAGTVTPSASCCRTAAAPASASSRRWTRPH